MGRARLGETPAPRGQARENHCCLRRNHAIPPRRCRDHELQLLSPPCNHELQCRLLPRDLLLLLLLFLLYSLPLPLHTLRVEASFLVTLLPAVRTARCLREHDLLSPQPSHPF